MSSLSAAEALRNVDVEGRPHCVIRRAPAHPVKCPDLQRVWIRPRDERHLAQLRSRDVEQGVIRHSTPLR